MKQIIALALLFTVGCTQAEWEIAEARQAALSVPIATTSAFPITEWSPALGFRWPSNARRMQVTVRTGEIDDAGAVQTFYAFVIADGTRLDRVFRGRAGDFGRFRELINEAISAIDVPGSSRIWGVNGGLYSGPRIGVGPAGGDPPVEVPGHYVARVLRSAGSMEDAVTLSNGISVQGM